MAIGVRPHLYTGAGLLALGAALSVATALRMLGPLPRDLHLLALLGGLTLVAQTIAFWYLPSFTKRGVVLDGMASYSGPILLPATIVAAAVGAESFRVTFLPLALGLFGGILLASALVGPRWRSGIPFWRTPGDHQRGDQLAMLTLATSAVWLVAGGALGLFYPRTIAATWPIALLCFTLGALAHYLPRARARPLRASSYATGVVVFQAGALGVLASFVGVTSLVPGGPVMLGGLFLAGLSLVPPGRGKPAGARLKDATPLLVASMLTAAMSIGPAVASGAGYAFSAYYGLITTLALSLGGLALLTLPVVFNQRPTSTWVLPAAGAAVAGIALLAAGFLTALPRWPGAALLAGAVLLWLAAMWPLRTPRRACPADGVDSS